MRCLTLAVSLLVAACSSGQPATTAPQATPAPTLMPSPTSFELAYHGEGDAVVEESVDLPAGLYKVAWTAQAPVGDFCFLAINVNDVATADDVFVVGSEIVESGKRTTGSASMKLDKSGRYAFSLDGHSCDWTTTVTPIK